MGGKASKLSCSGRKKLSKNEPLEDLIDYDELEHLFSTTNKTQVKGEAKAKSSSILDGKKAYNLSLLLGHLKMPLEDIQKIILTLDDSRLTEAQIRTMLNCAPERLELRALKEFKGDPEKLGSADRFALKMLVIPDFSERLKAMLFKAKFHERVDEVSPDIDYVISGSEEVKSSKKLARILEIVLATGNYMNRGQTRVAGASGFRISFLTKLLSTKTTDNKSTLLHVITNTILSKSPELLDVKDELKSVGKAAKVSSQMVTLEMDELKLGMKEIRDGIKGTSKNEKHASDQYEQVFSNFISEAEKKFKGLLNKYDQMKSEFKTACEFFGEDCNKITTEDFFGAFAVFLQHLETTQADTVKVKGKKEEIAKKEKEEVIQRHRKESRGSSFTVIPPSIDQNELMKGFEAMALKRRKSLGQQTNNDDFEKEQGTSSSLSEKAGLAQELPCKNNSEESSVFHSKGGDLSIVKLSSMKQKESAVPPSTVAHYRSSLTPSTSLSNEQASADDKKVIAPPPPPRRSSSLTCYDLELSEGNAALDLSTSLQSSQETDPPNAKPRAVPPPVKPKPTRKRSLPSKFNNEAEWIVTVEKTPSDQVKQESPRPSPVEADISQNSKPDARAPVTGSDIENAEIGGENETQTKGESLYKSLMKKCRESAGDINQSESNTTTGSLYSSFIRPKLEKEGKRVESSDRANLFQENKALVASNSRPDHLMEADPLDERKERMDEMSGDKRLDLSHERSHDEDLCEQADECDYAVASSVGSSPQYQQYMPPALPQNSPTLSKLETQDARSKSPTQLEQRNAVPTPLQNVDKLSLQETCARYSPRDLGKERERSSSSASSTSAEVSSFLNGRSKESPRLGSHTSTVVKPVSILKKGPSPVGKSEGHYVKFSPNERQEIGPFKSLDQEDESFATIQANLEPHVSINIPPPPSVPPPLPPVDDKDATVVLSVSQLKSAELAASREEGQHFTKPDVLSTYESHSDTMNNMYSSEMNDGTKDTDRKEGEASPSLIPNQPILHPPAPLPPPTEFSNDSVRRPLNEPKRKTSRVHRVSPPKEPPPPPPLEMDISSEKGEATFPENNAEPNECIQNATMLSDDINSLFVSALPSGIDKGPPSFVPAPPPIDRSNKPRGGSMTSSRSSLQSPPSPTDFPESFQDSYVKDINKNFSGHAESGHKARGNSISSVSSVSSASLPPPPSEVLLDDFDFQLDDFDIGPPPSIAPPPPPTQFSSYLTST